MIKKITAAVTAAALYISGISFSVFAQSACDTNINTGYGIQILQSDVNYINDYFYASLDVKNATENALDAEIIIQVMNEMNENVANAYITRNIPAGKTVPIKFNSTNIIGEEKLNVNVNIETPGINTNVYVSPAGNDNNDGTFNAPVKTLTKALQTANEFIENDEYNSEDISIIFKEGRYEIQSPVEISGFDNLSSLTLKTDGSEVVFSGGLTLKGSDFTRTTNTSQLNMFPQSVHGKIYSINLSDYGITIDDSDPIYTTMYYNGEEKDIAKYPNDGYSNTANTIWNGNDFSFSSEDIKNWDYYDEAWVRGYFIYEWDLAKGKVSDISNGTISVEQYICGSKPSNPSSEEDKPWYIYNLPAELDSENEYVIKDNILYFYPPQNDIIDSTFQSAEIQINLSTTDMLKISNIDSLIIENIVFENSQGYFINAEENVSNLSIMGCEFRNNSQSAVNIYGNNNLISSCDFHDIGGRGLIFGGGDRDTLTPSGSVVQNCYFYDTGLINRTNQPALMITGCGVTAKYNTVTRTPHTAVTYTGNNHIIEYNDIYNSLLDSTGDAGLIYVGNDLSNLGTVIRYNYLHDSKSGMGAIYWDDWLSGQTAYKNVFENVLTTIFIHGGVCNTFSGNYVKNGEYGARIRGKGFTIEVNGEKFNAWDEINGRYNAYGNVFLGNLVGVPESGGTMPGVPWKSDVWQNAFGNVLKYVNNKTRDTAEETTVTNNYFIDVNDAIYTFSGTAMSDLNESGNSETITAEQLEEYENIKASCGIYIDAYRTSN